MILASRNKSTIPSHWPTGCTSPLGRAESAAEVAAAMVVWLRHQAGAEERACRLPYAEEELRRAVADRQRLSEGRTDR